MFSSVCRTRDFSALVLLAWLDRRAQLFQRSQLKRNHVVFVSNIRTSEYIYTEWKVKFLRSTLSVLLLIMYDWRQGRGRGRETTWLQKSISTDYRRNSIKRSRYSSCRTPLPEAITHMFYATFTKKLPTNA